MISTHKKTALALTLYCSLAVVAVTAISGHAFAGTSDQNIVVAAADEDEAEAKAKAKAAAAKKAKGARPPAAGGQPPPAAGNQRPPVPPKAVVAPPPAPRAAPPPRAVVAPPRKAAPPPRAVVAPPRKAAPPPRAAPPPPAAKAAAPPPPPPAISRGGAGSYGNVAPIAPPPAAAPPAAKAATPPPASATGKAERRLQNGARANSRRPLTRPVRGAPPPPAAPPAAAAAPSPAAVKPAAEELSRAGAGSYGNPAPVGVAKPAVAVAAPAKLQAVQAARTRSVVPGTNRTIVKEPGNRIIVKQGNKVAIHHDETQRLIKNQPNATVQKTAAGSNLTIINNTTNNVQIISENDNDGHLIRRYRRDADGHEHDIIDNRPRDHLGRNLAIGVGVGAGIVAGALLLHSLEDVPEPRYHDLPPEKYVVRYENASDDDVYEALSAPPVERLNRRYSLDEVRETYHLRQHMRRIDLDDINFETGSWEVNESEYRKLERIARGMKRVIEANPNEVFLIEGYTDAVGPQEDNLSLSDRRAESVAEVLTREFQVPAENLTTQGYGEQYLKVDVQGDERANRRVAVRRITPLISEQTQRDPN